MVSESSGFNFKSAMRVLSESGIDLDEKVAKHQYDLAQMTVFDEMLGGDEYADMEFEEFLEFLVRVSFVTPYFNPAGGEDQSADTPIKFKLASRVRQVLQLVGHAAEFVDTTMIEDDDI